MGAFVSAQQHGIHIHNNDDPINPLPMLSTPSTLFFLSTLPPELRVKIYEYLYSNPCDPVLIIRNDTHIQQPMHRWFKHPGAGLLLTCRTIYHEASPIMYSAANFRIQMHIASADWPAYAYVGPMDSSNTLLKWIQRVDVTIHVMEASHVDPAIRRLGIFAAALRDAGAELNSLRVTFKPLINLWGCMTEELVARRREEVLRRLDGEDDAREELFRRMLRGAGIVKVV